MNKQIEELALRLRSYLPLGDGSLWSQSSKDIALAADALEAKERENAGLRHSYEAIQSVCSNDQVTMSKLIAERDSLAEQVKVLREALERSRNWFESQAKVVSKGCGSPFELMMLRDERDALDAALATGGK
jgi:hypothetical protein